MEAKQQNTLPFALNTKIKNPQGLKGSNSGLHVTLPMCKKQKQCLFLKVKTWNYFLVLRSSNPLLKIPRSINFLAK